MTTACIAMNETGGLWPYGSASRMLVFVTRPTTHSAARNETEAQLAGWMAAGLDGDASAHRQMLSALTGHLRAYFARRLRPGSAEIEDLVQETLLAIHLKRATWDRTQLFTPWAYAIARYKLIDHFRRGRGQVHIPLEDAGALFGSDDPEEGAVRTDLERLLGQLPERQRALIQDVKIQGFSIEEAARRRGVTAVSARVMLHRSLQWLSRTVRDEDR